MHAVNVSYETLTAFCVKSTPENICVKLSSADNAQYRAAHQLYYDARAYIWEFIRTRIINHLRKTITNL